MKKKITLATILALLAILVLWGVKTYNAFVTAEENVSGAWAQVENQYQRRSDLIPNLVETVKGYAKHENTTLQEVIEARAQATQVKVDAGSLDAGDIQKFQAAQNNVSASLGRLLAVAESYPELKANENFLKLQQQLEGTENRITVARNEYNEKAKTFNTAIRRFPANIIAGIGGFEKKGYFEAEAGAATAPKVQF